MARKSKTDDFGPLTSDTATLPVCATAHSSYAGQTPRVFDLRLSSSALARFRTLHSHLVSNNLPLANGQPVRSRHDVIEWMLERVQGSGFRVQGLEP